MGVKMEEIFTEELKGFIKLRLKENEEITDATCGGIHYVVNKESNVVEADYKKAKDDFLNIILEFSKNNEIADKIIFQKDSRGVRLSGEEIKNQPQTLDILVLPKEKNRGTEGDI